MVSGTATQQFVPIESIRDGIATLKSGELRAVIITNSLNLALKSEEEQQAVLMQFQNTLNSLDFPVEIFIQSRKLNIKPYLDLLNARKTEIKEDLLKIQIHEYIGFITKFTEETNIMTKHFFIVIPYIPQNVEGGDSANVLSSFGLSGGEKVMSSASFEAARTQIERRVATVVQGISRFGLRGQQLNTEEMVELFYKLFNPGDQNREAPKLEQK